MFTDASHWLHRPRYCCIYRTVHIHMQPIATCPPPTFAVCKNCTSHHHMHYLGRKHFTYGKLACRLFTKERKGGGGGKGADGEATCNFFFAKEMLSGMMCMSFCIERSKHSLSIDSTSHTSLLHKSTHQLTIHNLVEVCFWHQGSKATVRHVQV